MTRADDGLRGKRLTAVKDKGRITLETLKHYGKPNHG